MWKEECEIVLAIIVVVVDVEELERRKPASLSVEGPQNVSDHGQNGWFFGSLGRVRRTTIGQRRGRARGTPRVGLIRRDLAGRLKKCAGNCDRPAEGWLSGDGSRRSEGRGSSRK